MTRTDLADFYIIVSSTHVRTHETRTRTRAISVLNIFNIVFNISTLLNFITIKSFNNSTSFKQSFKQ